MKKLITVILLSLSLSATALLPDMKVDMYLLQVEQAIKGKNKDYNKAIVLMDKIAALKDKHKINLSIEFYYKYAKIILKSNDPAKCSKANEEITHYLTTTGKEGKYYREALIIYGQSTSTCLEKVVVAQAQRTKIIGMKFVPIPAGSFQMGDLNGGGLSREKPVHRVSIKEFYMGTTEVTQAQWQIVMGGNSSYFKGNNRPVENVSWNDIQKFIKKLNQQTGKQHRLPSEAEWEYAARASSTTQYSWGNQLPSCSKSAVNGASFNGGKSSNCYYRPNGKHRGTQPVASYQANTFGLYDMHGNVYEWVEDCWNNNYNGATNDGSAGKNDNCAVRVLRGGSWNDNPSELRSATRNWNTSSNRINNYGFRLVQARNP